MMLKIAALPKLYTIGGAVAVVSVAVIGVHVLTNSTAAPETNSGTAHVRVMSVAGLSSDIGPLPITGKVTSLSEATILSQTSGEIVSLPRAIGDYVSAGAIIAAFENSSQQAAVQQAQGSYDAAVAALSKATGSQSAENTRTSAMTALQSAYAALDDAVHTRADQLFTNAKTPSPELVLTVPNSTLVNTIQSQRVALETTLQNAQKLSQGTGLDVDASITQMLGYTQSTQIFLDNLIQAVNATPLSQTASASTLAADQTLLAAARTEVVTALSNLTSAKSAYDAAVSGTGGGASNDIKAAQANVTQALGALNAAKANLEKTIVRSPINGTIVSLPISRGDFVSTFAQVAVVSNPSALYVDTQVTPEDAKTVAIGNTATIGGTVPGVITFIAPSLDPLTNKIEVKVGIKGDQSSLTNGAVVTLSLTRTQATRAVPTASDRITIPIVAAKITPAGPVVFTVGTSTTLIAHPITLGSILGDRVVVASGLTPDLEIVTDARGLAEGQTVIVDAP